jgi:hypothetical protein
MVVPGTGVAGGSADAGAAAGVGAGVGVSAGADASANANADAGADNANADAGANQSHIPAFVGGPAGNQPHIGCSMQYNSFHFDHTTGETYFSFWVRVSFPGRS